MIKRVNISVTDEEHKRMKQIALDMDMSVSQIIQRCFFKLAHDEKMRAIIQRGEFTSHNVRDVKQKSSTEAEQGSSSLDPLPHYSQMELQKQINDLMQDIFGAEQ